MKPNILRKKLGSRRGFVGTIDALIFIMLLGAGSVQFAKLEKKRASEVSVNAAGEVVAQFNNAVRSYVSTIAGLPAPPPQAGVSWLKGPACGGLATNPPEGFLPCTFSAITPFNQTYATSFVKTGFEMVGTTLVSGLAQPGISVKDYGRLANLIALRAKGTPGFSSNTFGDYTGNPGVDMTGVNPSAQPYYGVVMMIASNSPNTDSWIRTDGSNSPLATINWNAQNLTNVGQVDSTSIVNSGTLTSDTITSASGMTNTGTLTNNGLTTLNGDVNATGKISSDELEVSGSLLTSGNNVAVGDKLIAGDVLATDVIVDGGAYMTKAVYDVRMVNNNAIVAKPGCPTGTAPFIFTAVSAGHYSPAGTAVSIYGYRTEASDNGASWTVRMKILTDNGTWNPPVANTDVTVLVITKCV